jgi:hypothetical protein
MNKLTLSLLSLFLSSIEIYSQPAYKYFWLNESVETDYERISDIPVPEGYLRVACSQNSFQEWLKHLPLKKNHDHVYLFDRTLKSNQNAHYKIIDIDVGDKDLQQCADAIIRLYAEYLYAQRRYDMISFDFTSGDAAPFDLWVNGSRPSVNNNKVRWEKSGSYDLSYPNFRNYLNTVFTYAGSSSLANEMAAVTNINDLQVGDVFIEGGFPGHGVIVVDLATDPISHKKIFMIAQSYMPAQEIHILKNLENNAFSPWYELNSADKLYTPEWTFEWSDLKRFTTFE